MRLCWTNAPAKFGSVAAILRDGRGAPGYRRNRQVIPDSRWVGGEASRPLRCGRSRGLGLPRPAPRSDGPVRTDVAHEWYRWAEDETGREHPEGGGWHELRRRWTCRRKHLPAKDVALAGGWRHVQMMQRSYQQADPETVERGVLDPEA